MARAHRVVILIVVMFTIIGLASLACAAEKIAPTPGTSTEDDGDDYFIIPGPTRKRNRPTAEPVPPAGALDSTAAGAAAPTPAIAASSLHHFSAVSAAASAALAGFFYF